MREADKVGRLQTQRYVIGAHGRAVPDIPSHTYIHVYSLSPSVSVDALLHDIRMNHLLTMLSFDDLQRPSMTSWRGTRPPIAGAACASSNSAAMQALQGSMPQTEMYIFICMHTYAYRGQKFAKLCKYKCRGTANAIMTLDFQMRKYAIQLQTPANI